MKGVSLDGVPELFQHRNPSGLISPSELPENVNHEFLESKTKIPSVCPECESFCSYERVGDTIIISCDNRCNLEFPASEFEHYKVSFEEICVRISQSLDLDKVRFESNLPDNVVLYTDSGIRIYIIVSPSSYSRAVREIIYSCSRTDSVALLVTPHDSISPILDIQALYSSGDLIYALSIDLLDELNDIRPRLDNLMKVKEIESEILGERVDIEGQEEIINRIDSNPRYILTELNHMRTLRENKELDQWEGDRLEKVSESAFSHLFPTLRGRGGQDDLFENVPDNLFYINNLTPIREDEPLDSLIGIVDTKSGSSANFKSEKVEGKHDEYLKKSRHLGIDADCTAHIFVTLSITSHNEIDFFDRISNHYRDSEYMVVLTAEAYMMLLGAYLSNNVSGELKLSTNTFTRAAHSLFHKESFYDCGNGRYTREVSEDPEDYKDKYRDRDDLLVISPDVVCNNFQDHCESDRDIEAILKTYLTA